jgi:hypothetical protein
MFDIGNPVFWLIGIILVAAGFSLLRRHFSAESRERRRRDRNHGRVISRRHGPSVRLAVDTKKPPGDR